MAKSAPSTRVNSPERAPKFLNTFAREKMKQLFKPNVSGGGELDKRGDNNVPLVAGAPLWPPTGHNQLGSPDPFQNLFEPESELKRMLDNVKRDNVKDRATLAREKERNDKLELDLDKLRSELEAVKMEGNFRQDKVVSAFTKVGEQSYDHSSEMKDIKAKFDLLEKKLDCLGVNVRLLNQHDSETETESYYEPEPETRSRKKASLNRVELASPNMFEALKHLRHMVPQDLDDRYPTSWIEDGASSIREYFADLTDYQVIQLLIKRFPKKYSGPVSRDLHGCKNLEDFKKKVVGLCRQSYSAGHDTIVAFLNYTPKKLGPKTTNFKALVVEILEESEALQSLSEKEIPKGMMKTCILNKIVQYLPYPIQNEIRLQNFQDSPNQLIDDLSGFYSDPIKANAVESHLRTLYINRGKPINAVGSEVVEESEEGGKEKQGGGGGKTDGKKLLNRIKDGCRRCGSGIHGSKECGWYKNHHQGPPCRPCGKATGYALFHKEEDCFQSPK